MNPSVAPRESAHTPAPHDLSAPALPLLRQEDLEDPDKFFTIRRVPLLDAHVDREYGPVDEALLRRQARNCNRMVARGDFPAIQIGHTLPWKEGLVTSKKTGQAALRPATHEKDQCEIVGFGSGFHVAPFRGVPTLHSDMHFHVADKDYARTFPYRSVERPPNPEGDPNEDLIDRIALLRTPPRRDLGALHYSQGAPALAGRIHYARDLPPITAAEDHPDTPAESTESAPEPATVPAAPEVSASEPPPPPNPSPETPQESPQMSMTPQELDQYCQERLIPALTVALRAALHEEAEGAVHEHEQYAEDAYPEDPSVSPEEENSETTGAPMGRTSYAAGEVGGGGAALPSVAPCPANKPFQAPHSPERMDYSRRADEQDQVLEQVFDRVVQLEQQLKATEFRERRLNYARELDAVRGDGYELDIDEAVSALHPESPADFEQREIARIRKNYRRSAVAPPRRAVDIARPDYPQPQGEITIDKRRKAVAIAQRDGISFGEALKKA